MGPDDTKDDESVPLLLDELQGKTKHRKPRRTTSEEDGSSGEVLPQQGGGLTLVFATLCIVDLFGVFPIVALPRAIINCGERANENIYSRRNLF